MPQSLVEDTIAMGRLVRSVLAAAATLVVGLAPVSPAGAIPLPLDYVRRPLTLPRGTLRLDGDFDAATDDYVVTSTVGGLSLPSTLTQTTTSLTLGAAVGIADDVEIRASVPFEFSPDAAVLDPLVEGRLRFVRGVFEAAAAVAVHVPTRSGAGLDLGLGVPMLLRVGDNGRFDLVPTVDLIFMQPTATALRLPLYYEQRLADGFSVGVHTGIQVPRFDLANATAPLGLFGRLSLPRDNGTPLADAIVRFDFDRFLGDARYTVDIHAYTIGVAGRLFLPL